MKKSLLFICILAVIASCKKDDNLTINQNEVTLHHDSTFKLTANYACTYSTVDSTVAKVAADGTVTGVLVGSTTILVKAIGQLATCKVTVTPVSNLYKEPYLIFGSTVASVKSYEQRDLLSETTTMLFYSGENSNTLMVLYSFENGKLESSLVMLNNSALVAEALTTYMKERYYYLGYSDPYYLFSNKKGILAAISVQETLGLNVIYTKESYKGLESATGSILKAQNQLTGKLCK
jgi:hypothetical protein